jgi:[ribosomal protein S18]-alanine N-acetyltransferase
MINLRLQVRRAVERDRRQISNLLFYEANTHRHLDWRSALDWIGSQHYWVLENDGRISAALSCPQDPPRVGWIRLFGYQPPLSAPEAWSALWDSARHEISQTDPHMQIAAIVVKHWFQSILLSSGFELNQNIVILRLNQGDARLFPPPHGIRIRMMQDVDLPVVTGIDLAAFGLFWHNTLDALHRAHSEAVCATVAEDDSGVVGYQISTGNFFHAHLARLAVRPEAQGRGVGTALLGDLIQRLGVHQLEGISVNTQADNAASLALYKKWGFTRTGEHFPVLVYS